MRKLTFPKLHVFTPCKQPKGKLNVPNIAGVDEFTPVPGHILLSHLPNVSDPDVMNCPVGHEGFTPTLSHALKVLYRTLGFVLLHVQFNCHYHKV